jgi:LysR family transcriptional regulator, glycine cleavage system transcriptional activator
MTHLPTTTSIRIVAALSQYGTVSAVAEAMNLTQSAVSKQLRSIETLVGLPLFRRTRLGLTPTPAGLIYIEQARIAIGALETAALRTAQLRLSRPPLRLHVLPILGDRWFMQRLPDFIGKYPDIDVQFVTFAPRETFRDVDLVFRFGEGNWPGWRADYFLGREVVLVGAPQLIAREGGIEDIRDVLRFRLLVHPQTPLHWADFFGRYGIGETPGAHMTPLGYYSLVIRAAIGGQGLALVPRSLVLRELQQGELVNPRGFGFESGNCYWLTTPEDREREGALGLFCNWALGEARKPESAPGDESVP